MTTYYVSAGGSNSNAGTSEAAPWLTVGKVNGASLVAGDRVLFRRGDSFTDTFLAPKSGGSNNPIVYGAYGDVGVEPKFTAAIFMQSKSWIRLHDLRVQGAGDHDVQGVAASASGSGVTDLEILRCVLTNLSYGVNAPNANDARWKILRCHITDINHDGAQLLGSAHTVAGNVIVRTGRVPGANPAHGVYAKCSTVKVLRNLIWDFDSSGISLRYRSALVEDNDIGYGRNASAAAIGWFQYDTVAGLTRILRNRISAIRAGIYVSPSDTGGNTIESFTVARNTIATTSSGSGDIGFGSDRGGDITLAHNVFLGVSEYAVSIGTHLPSSFVEHDNYFPYGATLTYAGTSCSTLPDWVSASGQGDNDVLGSVADGGGLLPDKLPKVVV